MGTPKIERRSFSVALRADAGGDDAGSASGTRKLVGHAALFDTPAVIYPGMTEVIRKGAFSKTVKESDVRALWNHNDDLVLGRTKSGTLRLKEDGEGLAVEIEPPDTQWGRDAVTSIDRGDVDQMSFAFRVVREEWQDKEDGSRTRVLLEVRLYDVSPVTYPAYEETEISVRNARLRGDAVAEDGEVLPPTGGMDAPTSAEPPPVGGGTSAGNRATPPQAGHLVTDVMRRRLDLAGRQADLPTSRRQSVGPGT